MRYPTFTRDNMRHRGPMESRKYNKQYVDIEYDMKHLYKQLEQLKADTQSMFKEMYEGGNEMSAQCSLVREKAEYLRGGESRV